MRQFDFAIYIILSEQSELTADDLQNILQTISKNQLDGIRTLQADTNKYFGEQVDKLFEVISVAAKSHPRGVPQPSIYSGTLSEDFAQCRRGSGMGVPVQSNCFFKSLVQ